MSAPVDDFDLDIRLGDLAGTGESVHNAATMAKSICQTYCASYCTTGCHASDCVCTRTQ